MGHDCPPGCGSRCRRDCGERSPGVTSRREQGASDRRGRLVGGLLLARRRASARRRSAVVRHGQERRRLLQAEPGEENRVKAESAAGLITVRDTGAQVIAGDGVRAGLRDHEATCQRNPGFPNQPVVASFGNKGRPRADALTGIVWARARRRAGRRRPSKAEADSTTSTAEPAADRIGREGRLCRFRLLLRPTGMMTSGSRLATCVERRWRCRTTTAATGC